MWAGTQQLRHPVQLDGPPPTDESPLSGAGSALSPRAERPLLHPVDLWPADQRFANMAVRSLLLGLAHPPNSIRMLRPTFINAPFTSTGRVIAASASGTLVTCPPWSATIR